MMAAVLILFLCGTAMARDQFEGKWRVTITPDSDAASAGEREFEDTLEFKGVTFTAEGFKERGFEAVEYESDTRGLVAASFTAKPRSKTDGDAVWSGFTTGQDIQGELVWTRNDGTIVRFTYKGTRE
jgi:hypothetical protein